MIEEKSILIVKCDGCQTWLHDHDYNVYFSDEEAIDEMVTEMEWSHHKGSHLCPTCTCEATGHRLNTYKAQGYRSCDCGQRYDRAVTVRDRLERV